MENHSVPIDTSDSGSDPTQTHNAGRHLPMSISNLISSMGGNGSSKEPVICILDMGLTDEILSGFSRWISE